MAVAAYLESRDGEKPLGVYAIYDDRHNLQYIGYSRNMVLAVKVSLLVTPGTCGKVAIRGGGCLHAQWLPYHQPTW
jgi:hypothetical protein